MDPVFVEVTRGDRIESAHRGALVVSDAGGHVVFAAGDIDQATYPRSAVKALLALPLVESGAADRLGLTDTELALACSSHSGEAVHVAAAASMLRKAGRDEATLECGAHWPANPAAARALAASGREPGALHNNCSGKHAGFVCLACARGDDPAGYVRPDHPTMRVVTAALAQMTGTRLDAGNRAIDGCSIPTFAVPLRALALAFARFATADGAAARLRSAVAAHPVMVGGSDSFDTHLMQAMGEAVFVKGGAEGVHCAALPALGLGVALKCGDGAGRASEIAMSAVLARLLPDRADTLAPFVRQTLINWNKVAVGEIRPGAALS